jgi:hypothetical protein
MGKGRWIGKGEGSEGPGTNPVSPSTPKVSRPPGLLDRLLLPVSVLATTLEGLSLGADREMLCYWIGSALPPGEGGHSRAVVTTVAFPRIESGRAYFRVVDGQMGLINEWCAERGLWVLGQVHTHPTDEEHSEADECYPASHRPGFLSVVIPFFAQLSTIRDPHWRGYRLSAEASWEDFDPNVIFEILPGVWLPSV